MWDALARESRLAGRKSSAQRFSAGKASECPGTAQQRRQNEILCLPRGTRIPFPTPPTVETVGYHLSRPGRSFAPLLCVGAKSVQNRKRPSPEGAEAKL